METHTSTFVVFSGKIEPLISINRIIICALLLTTLTNNAHAELNTEQKLAKTKGITLYNQYKATSAMPFLTIAAEAGDHEAQYYLGESLRRKNHYMNPEARKWYEASATQGDLYAMIQLGRSEKDFCALSNDCPPEQKLPIEWLKQAKHIAEPKAIQGDAEAMYVMYELTIDDVWLEKSAFEGNPLAQYWMAIGTRQGDGFFLPWKRHEAVGEWLRLSAQGGYPPAMMEYAAFIYEDHGDLAVARHWIYEAANAGYESGISSYGAYLAHSPSLFDFPLDLVKGYAVTSLLTELDGGGDVQVYVNETLPEIAEKMTPEQILEAYELAKEWKTTHPPLSFFPDKLSR
ncbi:tetratricopeptide repeat protein [Pseudomonas frederiksbergensis]|uniref:tetratricopeptide repeat protein n=1 Tax=Pseudomonas frederiksbergensis TaxID=104087 RepID=UPI0021825163|nr:sel1 repeat family protein [Pseudomonas frederiksbergensis]